MTMMDMSGHDQAAMSHEMMQNGNASAHRDMAEMHKNDERQTGATNESATSFSEMNEHEKPLLCTRRRIMVSLPLFISSRLKSIAARSPRINPQLHLLDPHLTPKSLAYAPSGSVFILSFIIESYGNGFNQLLNPCLSNKSRKEQLYIPGFLLITSTVALRMYFVSTQSVSSVPVLMHQPIPAMYTHVNPNSSNQGA